MWGGPEAALRAEVGLRESLAQLHAPPKTEAGSSQGRVSNPPLQPKGRCAWTGETSPTPCPSPTSVTASSCERPTPSTAGVSRGNIRRERHVANIGESTSATAIQRRDTELNLRSRFSVKPPAEGLSVNRVWDADGIEWPLCRVRAGDVIRIPDFTPSTTDLDRIVFDAYRTFFIEETHCDHVTGVLTIIPSP